jgi:hypothetical protein
MSKIFNINWKLVVVGLSWLGFAQTGKGLPLQGYQKLFLTYETYPSAITTTDVPANDASLQSATRLQASPDVSDLCGLQVAGTLQVRHESSYRQNLYQSPTAPQAGPEFRAFKSNSRESRRASSDRWLTTETDLDRALLRCALSWADMTVGRQAITFGTARVFSPSDVILPYGLLMLDQEYRIGVDGVRWQIPLGRFSELDWGVVIDRSSGHEGVHSFLRLKFPLLDADWTVLALNQPDATVISLGYEGDLQGMGIWFDSAAVQVDSGVTGSDYQRLSLGAEYFFPNQVYVGLEMHYNGAGNVQPTEYTAVADFYAYTDGGVFLFGQLYSSAFINYPLTPLLSLGGQITVNNNDESALWQANFERSLDDNLVWQGAALVTSGSDQSEFNRYYPHRFYTSINLYF